jgi:hypothetical protein
MAFLPFHEWTFSPKKKKPWMSLSQISDGSSRGFHKRILTLIVICCFARFLIPNTMHILTVDMCREIYVYWIVLRA